MLLRKDMNVFKNDLIRSIIPYGIYNSLYYNCESKKITENSIFSDNDLLEIQHESEIDNPSNFNLKFFPISTFFSNPESLKTICDEYGFDFRILITIQDNNFNIEYPFRHADICNKTDSLRSFCTITFYDIKKISDKNMLCSVLKKIDGLLLENIQKRILLCRRDDSHQLIEKHIEVSYDSSSIENTIICLDTETLITSSDIFDNSTIDYNLYNFEYKSIYSFQIDLSTYVKIDDLIFYIATYTLPDLDTYLYGRQHRRCCLFLRLKDDNTLEIITKKMIADE